MFQNFNSPPLNDCVETRLNALRQWMDAHGINCVLIPHNDEQNNEYLPADKERLAWISGFTGSAGSAIINMEKAILFVDGRYALQAAQQINIDQWTTEDLTECPPHEWLESNANSDTVLGFDPWLHMARQVKKLEQASEKTGIRLIELDSNPIDSIWSDQPAPPAQPVKIHDFSYAGRLSKDKLGDMQSALEKQDADFCILTDPASICWLFNIRGNDVAHTPITLAHALLRKQEQPLLFIDPRKLDIETRAFLTQVAELLEPVELRAKIRELSSNARVMIDGNISPYAFNKLVEANDGTVVNCQDPVTLARAVKNPTEIEGSRAAHKRDGAAVATFLAWLDDQPPGSIDEIAAARKLEQLRSQLADENPLRDISFDTISGSGPNGAIVHYRVDTSSNRVLQAGELYLCDSGGQYDDGTTDITRTVAIGPPGEEERRAYTLVLRGHIAISLARFPKGTRGVDLNVLARNPLWQHGRDYAHSTGHGVGSYLSVHEGPQNISRRGTQELLPGMIISNEPGYYRAGAFGIRIENLILVREAMDIDGGDIPMMGFETLTRVPLDQRLIDPTLLTDAELHWLNAYHGWVRRELEPLVSDTVAVWLRRVTEPVFRDLPAASA